MTALREITAVQQRPGEPPRRWFHAPDMDLFVWREGERIVRLHLAYALREDREHLYEWAADSGARHARIDDGARPGGHPRAPLVGGDAPCDAAALSARFNARAAALDPALRAFVIARLGEWPAAAAPGTASPPRTPSSPATHPPLDPLFVLLGTLAGAMLLVLALVRLAG
ncbi:MAG: hypothetical protein KDK06_10105 [Gammaproteobacteria bacterium]|nr:hypothetical protein [Gammaproteobacteria bacterium]